MSKNLKIVKTKESYTFYNLSFSIGYYSIYRKTCEDLVFVSNGDVKIDSSFVFTPTEEGEYEVQVIVEDTTDTITISHYPTLLKSIVKNIEKALCNCNDDFGNNDCLTKKERQCLLYQDLYTELGLATGIIKPLTNNVSNYNVITEYISYAVDFYKCDLFKHFCTKEVHLKIQGSSNYSDVLQKKIICINYLALYFYEKYITDDLKEYQDFVDNKYNYKTIKSCILKAGLDVRELEDLFSSLTYDLFYEPSELVCNFNAFINIDPVTTKEFTFSTDEYLNGVYDSFKIKNVSDITESFLNKILYKDSTFMVTMKVRKKEEVVSILPGESVDVDIVFKGRKPLSTNLSLTAKYNNSVFNNYKITFN